MTTNVLICGPTPPPEVLAVTVERLAAIDPAVEICIELYEEPHALRTARSLGNIEQQQHLVPALTPAQRAAFARADVALALDLPSEVRTVAPRLRWVHGLGAGTGQLQSAGLFDAGIALTSSAGVSAHAIAEFVMGRVLQHVKRFRELDRQQHERRWVPCFGTSLEGLTIGLVGYGAINRAVARMALAFDMTVLACHRTAASAPAQPEVDGVVAPVQRFAPDQLSEMVSSADVLVFAVPETVETTGMVTRSVLESMRPGSIFVNVGRGSLVDETALIELLRSGHLGAAILDVSSREPLPADDPLWDAPNLYYSPHCAVSIGKMFEHLYELFEENLRRFVSGADLLNRVVPGTGY